MTTQGGEETQRKLITKNLTSTENGDHKKSKLIGFILHIISYI